MAAEAGQSLGHGAERRVGSRSKQHVMRLEFAPQPELTTSMDFTSSLLQSRARGSTHPTADPGPAALLCSAVHGSALGVRPTPGPRTGSAGRERGQATAQY